MERIITGDDSVPRQLMAWFPRYIEQVVWEASRTARAFSRCFGIWGWCLLGCLVVGVLAGSVVRHQKAEVSSLQTRLAQSSVLNAASTRSVLQVQGINAAAGSGGRTRLQVFENDLLAHEEIPNVVQELLHLGEVEGLSMQRGEYLPQTDAAGGFLRYRMTLPVKGTATAIQRFIQTALRKQKTLALERVQFKRERIESSDIEARIQWVVLTRLPSRGVGSMETLTGHSGAVR